MARPRIYEEERVVTAIRLPVSLRDRLDERVHNEAVTLNSFVEAAISNQLDRKPASGVQ